MHVGIGRSPDTDENAVAENVKKARRTLYSLMSAGLHGEIKSMYCQFYCMALKWYSLDQSSNGST